MKNFEFKRKLFPIILKSAIVAFSFTLVTGCFGNQNDKDAKNDTIDSVKPTEVLKKDTAGVQDTAKKVEVDTKKTQK
jgi:hypothetical protein